MTALESATFDPARADAFAGRMGQVLSDASLALLCHLGHQLGLFDTLSELGRTTSEHLAGAAEVDERYVREWLGGATVGRIVEYDAASQTYELPAEHAACLTRSAGPDNLARTLAFLPMLAQVADEVMEAFRNGGGVPYSAYRDFHRLMADESDAVFDAALLDTVLPMVPGLPERLAQGIDVADIGCGSGHAINLMAHRYPRSRFVGYDVADEAVTTARREASQLGLTNARFEVQDVAAMTDEARFDLVTAFDAIHDQVQPATVLARTHRSLRTGGTFLMVDINASSHLEDNIEIPWAPFLYTVSLMHCMTVSLSAGGAGLGTVWGRQRACGMLDDAGFTEVDVREVDTDPFNLVYVASKG